MKTFYLLILTPLLCFSQSHVNNFVAQDNKLLWENVFFAEQSASIADILQKHPQLTMVVSKFNIYNGKAKDVTYACDGASDYLSQKMSFDFQIEVSDNKYTVRVYNIAFYKDNPAKANPAENFVLSNGVIKTGKVTHDLDCLDLYLNKIFTIASVYKNKS